jgi:hypothetical protein
VVGKRARSRRGFALAALAALGALLATWGAGDVARASGDAAARTPGSFVSLCGFSHRSADDPIVHFGRPGVSHDHSFVGNVSTDAFSTSASLRSKGTTCARKGDRAAYWAPTLLLDGRPVVPAAAAIYYTRLTAAPVRPFSPGLRMVAGDSRAGSPQSPEITFWDCGLIKTTFYGPMVRHQDAVAVVAGASVPRCPPATRLQLHVTFPDCWNGKRLDSLDHKGHMAYSDRGACPRSHPTAVPSISLIYQYPPLTDGTVTLASGGMYSGHADFMNAWDERALGTLIARCLNVSRACGTGP